MFKIYFLSMVLAFASIQARAVETLVSLPLGTPKGLVVIAPAKKYLMQERLFTELAAGLTNQGYVTVRFNWSPDTLQVPELEFQRASQDIVSVLLTAQKDFSFRAEQTILISKSFSTKVLDALIPLAKTQILLTPNCSPEAPFQKTYGNILNQSDLSLRILISNEDPYCNIDEIRQTLKTLSKTHLLTATHGDHNFVEITPSSDNPFFGYQDQVIQSIVDGL